MDFRSAFHRASRAVREDARLHVFSVSSLTVAFLCLASALLAITNLSHLADCWGRSGRMTVYLKDGAARTEIGPLVSALEALPEVRSVEVISNAEAREEFLRETNMGSDLASLPPEVFPASLEIALKASVRSARAEAIAAHVRKFAAVEDVETYRALFERLEGLLKAGRTGAGILAALVIVCVLAIVGNTIRLAVAGRREEIEILKLCGATNGFVRAPFLVEGGLQALVASAMAVGLLFLGYALVREPFDHTFSSITGVRAAFLPASLTIALVLGASAAGVAASAASLRRYLAV